MRMWLHSFKQVPVPQPQHHFFFVSKFLELIMNMHNVNLTLIIWYAINILFSWTPSVFQFREVL